MKYRIAAFAFWSLVLCIAPALISLTWHTPQCALAQQPETIQKILENVKLPPGFKIRLYALVLAARSIAVGPQGKLVFVETMGTKLCALTSSSELDSPPRAMEFAAATPKNYPHVR